jgi:hypothetical protein
VNALSSARAAAAEPSHDRNAGKTADFVRATAPIYGRNPRRLDAPGALAVFDLLDELREKIWRRYNVQLQQLLEEQRGRFCDDGDANLGAADRQDF